MLFWKGASKIDFTHGHNKNLSLSSHVKLTKNTLRYFSCRLFITQRKFLSYVFRPIEGWLLLYAEFSIPPAFICFIIILVCSGWWRKEKRQRIKKENRRGKTIQNYIPLWNMNKKVVFYLWKRRPEYTLRKKTQIVCLANCRQGNVTKVKSNKSLNSIFLFGYFFVFCHLPFSWILCSKRHKWNQSNKKKLQHTHTHSVGNVESELETEK